MSQRAIYKRTTTGSPKQLPVFDNLSGPEARVYPLKHFISLPNGVKSRVARGESSYHSSTTTPHHSVPVKGIHSPDSQVNGIVYNDRFLKPPDNIYRGCRERHNVNIVYNSTEELTSSVGRYQKHSKSTPPVTDRNTSNWVLDHSSVRGQRLLSDGSVSRHYVHNGHENNVIYANVNGSVTSRSPLDQSYIPRSLFISPRASYAWDVNNSNSPGVIHNNSSQYLRPSSPASVFSDRGSDYVSTSDSMRGDTVIYNSPSSSEVVMMGNYYDPRDIYRDNRSNGSLAQSRGKFSSMPILYVDKNTEKKLLKQEKKREKEEKKRYEKEEKKRKKAEKKAATLNSKTLPKSWGYDIIHRNIEDTYTRPRLKMRAVPIEFEDRPNIPPPRPIYVQKPGLQKKYFYTSVPNLQQAIYANTPSIQRVEQVYGTSSRYALKPFIPNTRSVHEYAPKTVILQRRPEGYGFVLRGARSQSQSASLEFQPTAEFPALQYLDSVDPGSQSDRAGLKTGDFILEINGENVIRATHERVVQLIRTSKDTLGMKVVTARPLEKSSDWFTHQDGSMTLPNRKKQAPLPPKRNPDTSLSYSKATSKSVAEGLAEIEKLDQALAEFDMTGNRQHSISTNEISNEKKTASVRGSHAIKRVSCVDINHIVVGDHMEPTYDTPAVQRSKDYMSPAELRIKKYHKKQNGVMERSKSTPDLAVPDEVVYASTTLPGSGMTVYDRSSAMRSQVIYQKPGSPGHYRQGHMADIKRPMSHVDSDRLKTAVYAGPVVIRTNTVDSEPPALPSRASAPTKPSTKSELISISTSRNDNIMYANVSAEINARKQNEKEESPYESSFRPGTLARLTNQPKVTTASLEQAKLKSHRKSNSVGAITVDDTEVGDKNVSFADDRVIQNAATFIQKHPNAKLLVTADVHQKKEKIYYEPEPDYDNESDEERYGISASSLRIAPNHCHQSSSNSSGSRNTEDAKLLAHEAQKSVRPKSTSVTVISVGDATIKKNSPVTERHYSVHSDIPSAKKPAPQSQSDTKVYSDSKIFIPPRPTEPAPSPPASNITVQAVNNYSNHTMKSSSTPPSSVNSSRRSSIQSGMSGGKDDGISVSHVPATLPKPQFQEETHTTPPPQAPPPPPPPPAPHAPPPVPSTMPPPLSQESQTRSPARQDTSQPQISASDIMKAVKLRQSRLDNETPRMSQTKPNQPPAAKTKLDLNQEALKAAVAARKSRLLQQEEESDLVDQIESRLQKTKKLQSSKYFFSSDTIKTEPKTPEDQTKNETTITEKVSTKKGLAPQPPSVSAKPKSPQVAVKSKNTLVDTSKLEAKPTPPSTSQSDSKMSNDFLAMAEKARLAILQKKTTGTKNTSVTPIYSSSSSKSNKKTEAQTSANEESQMSIKDKIASFEKQKMSINDAVSNGNNIELDGVTEDHSHTEAGNTLTRNSAFSPVVAPPPGFSDNMQLEIIPPPVSFSNDASVDSGHGSDHYNSAFGHDDSASLVSSASTLSTLSSEQGEHIGNRGMNYDEILPPPPPGFSDNMHDYEDIHGGDVIPPPPQFSNSVDNKPKPLRPYQTKSVDSWLCTDVLDWLDSLSMAQYKTSFAKNCIDGPKLLMLGRNDYIQLGVTQVGHRMNLERSIKKVALGKISTAM